MLQRTKTAGGGERVWFWCGGCDTHHAYTIKLGPGETGPCWTFSGTLENPTFTPSLLCNKQVNKVCDCDSQDDCEDDSHAKPAYGYHRCHLYLRGGQVQYLSDCTHALKGQTVPVEPPRF